MAAADFKERMRRFSRTVTLCAVTRDTSNGQVSVEADGKPKIDYTLNAVDEETILEGIEKGLRVLIAAGATEVGTHQQDGERFCVKGAHILILTKPCSHMHTKISYNSSTIVHTYLDISHHTCGLF